MKTIPSKFITAGLTTFLIAPVFAIEAPEDDAPPPPLVKQAAAALPQFKLPPDDKPAAPARQATQSETAFLGIVSGEVPEYLAEHLDLGKGGGIIVRSMAPDSPAIQSGIAVNDVITMVAGNPVGSQEDLSNQITAHKPGEIVSLSIIHKGKPTKIDVTLGTRPANIVMEDALSVDDMNLETLPKEMADHIRKAIGGLDLKLGGDANSVPPQMEDAIRELHKRMMGGNSPQEPRPQASGNTQSQSSATLKMKDNDGSIEVKSKDGAKEVTVRDQQDNVVWSGPWDSEADQAAAPDSVRARMENLNLDTNTAGGGLRFHFNRKADPANPDH